MKLVADRLGLGEQLVNDALRGRQPAVAPPWERRDHGGWRGGRDGARRGGGRDRFRDHPSPPPEPIDPRAALTRREQSEAAFLAYCLALPEEGERRLAEVDVDDYFSAPATRKAAAYLRGRLRTPTANLPAGDDDVRPADRRARRPTSGALEATPAQARARGAPARPPPPRTPHLQRPRHRRDRRHGARRRAPESARRDPPPAAVIPSATRTSVRVVMDRATLASPARRGPLDRVDRARDAAAQRRPWRTG